jgi:predicted nucleic acid-binding protein
MNLFWDSSALLAIIFSETRSLFANEAWDQSDADYAWRWLKVEAISAAARRGANPGQWKELHEKLAAIHFIDIPTEGIERICTLNRNWKLRSADAGHLYTFQQIAMIVPDVQLVCFDNAMISVAGHLGLKLWQPNPPTSPPALAREPRSSYGRKSKRTVHV